MPDFSSTTDVAIQLFTETEDFYDTTTQETFCTIIQAETKTTTEVVHDYAFIPVSFPSFGKKKTIKDYSSSSSSSAIAVTTSNQAISADVVVSSGGITSCTVIDERNSDTAISKGTTKFQIQ